MNIALRKVAVDERKGKFVRTYFHTYFLCKAEDNNTWNDHKTLDNVRHANTGWDDTRDLENKENDWTCEYMFIIVGK